MSRISARSLLPLPEGAAGRNDCTTAALTAAARSLREKECRSYIAIMENKMKATILE